MCHTTFKNYVLAWKQSFGVRMEDISSVESQKGAITIQRCSVENQKGAITIV